jgi:glyoxylase-like metal-dependent hydrolase (beta-lactamase superfamily II)
MITILGYSYAQDCVIEQVTDRILYCKCTYKEEHRAFYINSKSGLIVVDTYYFPWLTKQANELVYSKTGRNDYICLINTHGHGCHVGGNYLFNNITRIGHDSILIGIQGTKDYHFKKYNQLKESIESDSSKMKEFKDYEMLINIPNPTKVFADSMNLDFGDITIKLLYFGFSGHSKDETLIYIPQEKTLIIGQIFGASFFLPVIKSNCTKADLQRKINLMSDLIKQDLKHILSNHQGEITKVDFIFARDYLIDLSNDIKRLRIQGLSLDEIKKEFQLDKKYPELAKRHVITNILIANNNKNIDSIWSMINKNGN